MSLKKYCLIVITWWGLAACSHTPWVKRSDHATLYSAAMARDMPYSVYTPPGWTVEEALPMVVLLHGARDDQTTFDRYRVGGYLDALIAAGELPRVVIVSPDGELGFWENWYDGTRKYRDWVIRDLMPFIAQKYSTLPCPQYCHVSGMSMGAHGAMRFAYYEPGAFSSVAAISGLIISKSEATEASLRSRIIRLFVPVKRIWGDIRGDNSHVPEDLDPYVSWVQKPELAKVRLYLAWGSEESSGIIKSNELFQAHLEKNRRPHAWWVYNGGHKWRDWRQAIAESVRFHIAGRAPAATVVHDRIPATAAVGGNID